MPRSKTCQDETFWTAFLRSLKTRGLSGVRLVISDAHAGLKAAIRKTMSGTSSASFHNFIAAPNDDDLIHRVATSADATSTGRKRCRS